MKELPDPLGAMETYIPGTCMPASTLADTRYCVTESGTDFEDNEEVVCLAWKSYIVTRAGK